MMAPKLSFAMIHYIDRFLCDAAHVHHNAGMKREDAGIPGARQFTEVSCTCTYDARHKKTDLEVFVVVIPKEGWARMAAPILLEPPSALTNRMAGLDQQSAPKQLIIEVPSHVA